MYFRAFFRCREIRSQNVWKVTTCWSTGGKYQQSSSFRRYTRCFGCTGYKNFMMPKAKTKGSKKRYGGSNAAILNGKSAKETVLSEMREFFRLRKGDEARCFLNIPQMRRRWISYSIAVAILSLKLQTAGTKNGNRFVLYFVETVQF